MIRYVIKRISFALLTIFSVATITFFLMFLVGGGPFLREKGLTQETEKALMKKYGLDKPKIVQYRNYMLDLVKGDLGVSLKHRDKRVNDIIKEGFPASAKIGGIAATLAICVGVPLGSLAAYTRGKFWDNLIMFFATLGIAIPRFVVAIALLVILGVKLHKFPSFGLETPAHYVLPVLALTFYPAAYIIRLTRSSMLDVLGQDYMRTAKAKGLSQLKSIFKHALRNAILPVMVYIGPMLAQILIGGFAVERVFSIPGIGRALTDAVVARDYSLIMGVTIFITFLIVSMNVLVDILSLKIDPRIKLM